MASLRYPLLGGIKLIISLRMNLELTSFLLEKYPMYVGKEPELKKYRSRENFTRSANAGKQCQGTVANEHFQCVQTDQQLARNGKRVYGNLFTRRITREI